VVRLLVFLNKIDEVNEKVGKGFSFLIFPLIGVVAYEVVMRYALNAPTEWGFEVTGFLFGTYAMLSGAYTFVRKAHVNVDIFYGRFSPRKRAIVNLFTSLIFFLFAITLLWKGSDFAWKSVMSSETSGSPWNPPVYPVKLAIPVGTFLLLIVGVVKYLRDLTIAISGVGQDEH
jgi:TRAP-type mannitol/chloroaromatic compound transport system permease small subunit